MITDKKAFLDFHSHILPGVDDGSRDLDESRALLDMLKEQGIETVMATPHFDADRERVESFVKRRNDSYQRLLSVMTPEMPNVRLGAEVAYYPGISRLDELSKLCIEGTNLVLLEMPMSRWSRYTVDELVNMTSTRGVQVIIAHVERCLKYQDRSSLEAIYRSDVLLQINASFIIELSTRRKAINLLKKGLVQLVGSDCHNVRSRKPKIGEAYEIISGRLGDDFVRKITNFGRSLIIN